MLKFFKKPLGIIVIIIAVIVGAVFFLNRPKAPTYDFVVAEKRNLVQEVSITGRVKPAKSVDLAFEKSGKVERVSVQVGQKVASGNILVVLNSSELKSQLQQAEANVRVQQAKLNELKQGTRPEEIQIQETKVANAAVALNDARQTLIDSLQDAFTKSDDAVRNKVDQIFVNPRTTNPQLYQYLNIAPTLKINLIQERVVVESLLNAWKDSAVGVMADLNYIKSFLGDSGLAVNSATPNADLSQTTLDVWKAAVASARTNVNTAISNLTTADGNFKSAESALALAQQQLLLEKAGTIAEQIAGQEAQVEQVQAQVDNLKIQIAKTVLYAPISGVVSRQDAKVGEIVPANTPIVFLISESQFEIEADVPEADIAKIKEGDAARITLDAYGSDVVFQGKVVSIDPAETIIEGVATYNTKIQFLEKDDRIKSGMTANIDITGQKKEGVLAISQGDIMARNGDKFVNILENGKSSEKKITTGFRGSDGYIEITGGISEGDKVIISAQ